MTDVSTEGAVDTPKKLGRPGSKPFGIEAKPGSKLYHRLYSRAHKRQRLEQAHAEGMAKARAKLTPALDQHVSLRQLSEQQGWPVDRRSLDRLKAKLLARQKLAGVVLLVKLGVSGPISYNSHYYTTIGLLRRYASELFSDPENDRSAVKEYIEDMRREMSDLKAEVKRLKNRLKLLERTATPRAAA